MISPAFPARRGTTLPLDGRMLALAALPFSLEVLFVLFVFAGCYKGDPRWEGLPVDLTALFLVLSGAAAAGVLLRPNFAVRSRAFPLLAGSAAFFLFALLSLLWSEGTVYAGEKAKLLGVLTLWSFAACALFISSRRARVIRLLAAIVLFAAWIAVECLLQGGGRVEGETLLGASYLMLGRTLGAGAVIALGFAVAGTRRAAARWGAFALCALFLIALLKLGGRMPLLAAGAGMLTPLGLHFLVRGRARLAAAGRAAWLPCGLLLLLAAGLAFTFSEMGGEQLPRTIERFTLLLEGDFGHSGASRVEFARAAGELWLEAPIAGHGLGSWPLLYLSEDARHYPHNLFLETAVECGALGVLFLLGVHVAAFRALGSAAEIQRDPLRLIVLMLGVCTFCNAMVSGDFPDNRFHFAVLGLMLLPHAPRSPENPQ